MLDPKNIFPIGIGTWGIGGFAERDPKNDDKKQIEALVFSLKNGMNYVDVNLWYSQGKTIELIAESIKRSGVDRKELFFTQKFYPFNITSKTDAWEELKKLKKLLNTDYIDSVEITVTLYDKIGIHETIKFVKEALSSGVRYTNITNANLEQLKYYYDVFGEKIFGSEVGFNFEIRENFDNGVIPFCIDQGIKNIIYQPLRRNRTAKRNWPLLAKLSEKYKVTQNNIVLSWLLSKNYLPVVKSATIENIKENLESLKLKLNKSDIEELDAFRPPDFKTPKVYYTLEGDGVRVDQLSNVFDEEYVKQSA